MYAFLFFTSLCISFAVSLPPPSSGTKFIAGERQDGDYIIDNRTIMKPSWNPWKPMIFTVGIQPNTTSEIITYVNIASINGTVTFLPLKGDVGTNSLVVKVFGSPGKILMISIEAYGIDLTATTTTEATTPIHITTNVPPVTTEEPTTPGPEPTAIEASNPGFK